MKTLQSKFIVISIDELISAKGGHQLGPYSQSFSNLDDNGTIDINDEGLDKIGVVTSSIGA